MWGGCCDGLRVQGRAGTDHVSPWSDDWPDLFNELATLASQAGISTAAVLQSATLGSARAAGWEEAMGSIEAGKLANLVVLAKDPLADLVNLRTDDRTRRRDPHPGPSPDPDCAQVASASFPAGKRRPRQLRRTFVRKRPAPPAAPVASRQRGKGSWMNLVPLKNGVEPLPSQASRSCSSLDPALDMARLA